MTKLTWVSTPTMLICRASRSQAYATAPEGALLLNHDPAANKPASVPFAVIRNGKPVKVTS